MWIVNLLGWLTGLIGPITSVLAKLSDLQIAKVAAATTIEKAKIDQQIEEAHDRQNILIAEAGNRVTAILNTGMRMLITLGPALFLLKVFLWDKVIGAFAGCVGTRGPECDLFTTDSLDINLWAVVTAIIAFYFLYDMFTRKSNG